MRKDDHEELIRLLRECYRDRLVPIGCLDDLVGALADILETHGPLPLGQDTGVVNLRLALLCRGGSRTHTGPWENPDRPMSSKVK